MPQQSSAAIQEMSATAEQVANEVGQASEQTSAANGRVQEGLSAVEDAETAVGHVRNASQAVASAAVDLDEASDRIAQIAGILERWDGDASVHSAGAAAYHLVVDRLLENLLREPFGPELYARYLKEGAAVPWGKEFARACPVPKFESETAWRARLAVARKSRRVGFDLWPALMLALGGLVVAGIGWVGYRR